MYLPLFIVSALEEVVLGYHLKLSSGTEWGRSAFLSVEEMIKRKDTIGKFANGG